MVMSANQDVIWDYFQNEGAAAFAGSLPRLQFLVGGISPGERMLNIGVGAGGLEMLAFQKGIEVFSLDPSERSIMKLRDTSGIGDRAQTGYSQENPFPDEHFDVVVMTEVLEHLDTSVVVPSLQHVARVLRTGGRLVGTVPAREDLSENTVVCPSCSHQFHRWGHELTFDRERLEQLLKEHFTRVRITERFFTEWAGVSPSRKAASVVKTLLSHFGIGTYGKNRNFYFQAWKGANDGGPR
jgi:SAM-dependent methyltransferase